MLITKKARAALLVMLFAISILPGCGKNKNADPGIAVGVAPVTTFPGVPAGSTSFAFYGNGQLSNASSGLYGTFSSGGNGAAISPYQFQRLNSAGDRIFVSTSGSSSGSGLGYTQVTVSGVVSLSAGSIAWYQTYCGGMPNTVIFNGQVLSASGTISTSVGVGLGMSCGINL